MTYIGKLLDDMCKYEMDPACIVEDAEQTRSCPQMDRRADGRGETSIPSPLSTSFKWVQIILPLTPTPILMATNEAYIYIMYIHIYVYI